MRVTVLGSGSRGNSVLVESPDTRILVDAGFSGKEMARRLRAVGVEPEHIDGIVVTHDHADHTRGVGVLARRFSLRVFITPMTLAARPGLLRGTEEVVDYRGGHPFSIGSLTVTPFLTVHDAADPVAVSVTEQGTGQKVGIATDLGRPTTQIRHALEGCELLILEANHDEVMLRTGPYPRSVQDRIASSHGHLSNHAAAAFGCELAHDRLGMVLLAHLSQECNDPALALEVVRGALRDAGWAGTVEVAAQEEPHRPIDLGVLRERTGPAQLRLI